MLVLSLIGLIWSLFAEVPERSAKYVDKDSLHKYTYGVNGKVRYFDGELAINKPSEIDDSNWKKTQFFYMNPAKEDSAWQGTRWSRVYMRFDPRLAGVPLTMSFFRLGKIRAWVNDELILDDFSTFKRQSKGIGVRGIASFAVPVPTDSVVFTIHFYNPELIPLEKRDNFIYHVLSLTVNYPEDVYYNDLKRARFLTLSQGLIVGFCMVFSMMHFILFLFNRRLWFNLWFALFCFLFGFIGYFAEQWFFFKNMQQVLLNPLLMQSIGVLCFNSMACYAYTILQGRIPQHYYIIAGLSIPLALFNFTGLLHSNVTLALVLLLGFEIIRFTYIQIRNRVIGAWVLGSGIILFISSIFGMVIIEMAEIQIDSFSFGFAQLPYLGFASAIISMSVYHSQHLSRLNLSLSEKLNEVRELSTKTLEQERSIRASEIERVKLEAENQRKTEELENARKLQLSMLPKSLPEFSGYEMHAEMHTASEVGGDYYDVIKFSDTHLVWGIGDATGHGTEAGFVVAMTKTLFQSLPKDSSHPDYLRLMSQNLKKAGLKTKFMCFGLLKLEQNKVSWTSAGIPSALLIRATDNVLIPLISKGMPLGTASNFDYVQVQVEMNQGDIILLFSDGLLEQQNQQNEQFEAAGIHEALHNLDKKSPRHIIKTLMNALHQWRGSLPLRDDVSIVVLQKTITKP